MIMPMMMMSKGGFDDHLEAIAVAAIIGSSICNDDHHDFDDHHHDSDDYDHDDNGHHDHDDNDHQDDKCYQALSQQQPPVEPV